MRYYALRYLKEMIASRHIVFVRSIRIELRKEIESKLRQIYAAFGFADKTAIDRRVKGQFKMLAITKPKMITLDDEHEMIVKPLFITVDDNEKTPMTVHRDGEIYSKRKETWLVLTTNCIFQNKTYKLYKQYNKKEN